MTSDDEADTLDRVRRAKTRQRSDRWLDGGAVAAGVVGALGPQTLPAFLLAASIPESMVRVVASVTLLAVLFGAYVAGWLGGPGAGRGARHGATALAASTAGAAFAAVLLTPDRMASMLGGATFPVALVSAVAVGGGVGALIGSLGGRRRADA
ncbi:hypothetical protein [Halorussus amylolyticus]|uniref:hypothetical protein n=1 Tax=Halorussus amylolyticus TaxID=1126242 RepID=UPI00104545A6|nr:hypothetical protein [Halorussus amylolyticus]